MNAVADILGHVSPTSAYTVVAGAVLAESVVLVGAFIPTLTLLLTAGALARTGQLSLPVVIAVAAGAVVAGDFLAHRTGRLLGEQLRSGRVGSRVPETTWRRAEMLMTRHGGRSILLARFLPVVRTLAPHFAGATRLPYRRIAPFSVVARLPVGDGRGRRRLCRGRISPARPHPGWPRPRDSHPDHHRDHTPAASLTTPHTTRGRNPARWPRLP
ncbi:DedA family protein [Streptomyces sp. NPDC013978]|uniref:DedA family protein n=1 Tax=Streptomyces sp. NPDC013978 TaxID=3364869 RepID=UPI0036F70F6F